MYYILLSTEIPMHSSDIPASNTAKHSLLKSPLTAFLNEPSLRHRRKYYQHLYHKEQLDPLDLVRSVSKRENIPVKPDYRRILHHRSAPILSSESI